MFQVQDIEADVKRVLGGCNDTEFFSRLNHAVEILSTESEWDPLLGYVDVRVNGNGYATLPPEVGTPLSVDIDGSPAQGHDWLFKFHLNGPGVGFTKSNYHWIDGRPVCVFRDPDSAGVRLVAEIEHPGDEGKSFRVFGYGVNGDWIRTVEDGNIVDGFLVPLVLGTRTLNANSPLISRISRIQKDATNGVVRLYQRLAGVDTRIGKYFPLERDPQYRRIQVSKTCSWARVAFRKGEVELTKRTDLIPLHSKYAIVLMVKALKKMDDDRIDEAEAYQKQAVRLLTRKQETVDIPGGPSVQMAQTNLLADRSDRME